jgi:hypothetical protein
LAPELLFAHASSLSAIIPLVASRAQWKALKGTLKLIFWVAAASGLADLTSIILLSQKINSWPIINLFLIVQFALLFVLLNAEKHRTLQIFFYVTVIFALLNYLFIQTPKTFNSYTAYAGGILMIVTSLVFLYQLLVEMPMESIQRLPLFWVSFGVLIYYGGTLFLFLFNNYLLSHSLKSHQTIWVLHNVLNVTKNVFLFVALWINYKSRRSQ